MSKYVRIKSKESKGFKKNCVKVADKTFTFEKYLVGTRPEFEKTLGLLQPVVEFLNADHEEVEAEIYQAIKHIQDGDRESLEMVSTIAALEGDIKEISQEYNRVSAVAKETFTRGAVALKTEIAELTKKLHITQEDLELEKALYKEAIKAAQDYKLRYDALKQGKTPGQLANDFFVKQCNEAREAAKAEDWNAVKEHAAAARAGATAKAEAKEKSSSVFTQEMLLDALKKAERILCRSDVEIMQGSGCCSAYKPKTSNPAAASDPLTNEMIEEIIFGMKSVAKDAPKKNPCKDIPFKNLSPEEFLNEASINGWSVGDYLGSVMFTGRFGKDIYTVKKSFVDDYYRVAKNGKVGLKLPVKNEYQLFLPTVTSLIAKGMDLKDMSFTKA